MSRLQIHIDVQGEHIAFDYSHKQMDKGVWEATIIDECKTIEEILLAESAEKCLDELVPFLQQLGTVVTISSLEDGNPNISKLHEKLNSTA